MDFKPDLRVGCVKKLVIDSCKVYSDFDTAAISATCKNVRNFFD
jgi:hypothetical protein